MRGFLLAIVFSLLTVFHASAQDNRIDGLRPDAPTLAKRGSYHIGVRTLQLLHKNQVDALNVVQGQKNPLYNRPLTTEIWYPANTDKIGGEYKNVTMRDGKTTATLYGSAVRDAAPLKSKNGYPVIVISHGYPGNRYLMSHFAENLASKGYVAVAVDHTDSTYRDPGAFPSTLLNRSLDQNFLLDEMIRFNQQKDHFLENMIDTSKAGLIGYSMGGYGSVITAGGGLSNAATNNPLMSPNGILSRITADNKDYDAALAGRFKAIIAIAPWGMENGVWDADSLKNITTPLLFTSGSVDTTSGYEQGTRRIFELSVNTDRYLLTYESAGHSAAAPIPSPKEAYAGTYPDGSSTFAHYNGPVWDTLRSNNIAQHFATAFFARTMLGDENLGSYLDVIPRSNDSAGKTLWKGFAPYTAKGLKLEFLPKQQN